MATEVSAAAPRTVNVAIPAGQSMSDLALVNGKVVGIYMPSGWDAADITFMVSQDASGNGVPVYDDGVERMIPSAQAVAGRLISLDLKDWLLINVVRIRSGTSGAPVNQTARRDFALVLAG